MSRLLPLAAVVLCVLLWSTAYLGSAEVLGSASPAALSVLRYVIALAVLTPFAMRRPGFRRLLADPRSIVLGLTGIAGYYGFVNVGLLFTTAGTAALVSASLPALTALAAVVLLRERPVPRVLVGLALATIGVGVIAAGGFRLDIGVVLNLIGLAAYGVYTALLRRWAEPLRADAVVIGTVPALWGTVLMLPWLGYEGLTGTLRLPQGPTAWLVLVFLALVVTALTLVLFVYGAARLPATVSGTMTAGIPVLGYALAVGLGETPTLPRVLGGLLALAGVVVAALPGRSAGSDRALDGSGADSGSAATVRAEPLPATGPIEIAAAELVEVSGRDRRGARAPRGRATRLRAPRRSAGADERSRRSR